jgi:hypothetical protein
MSHGVLDREEYIEQGYFFRALRERMLDHAPMQETLRAIREELLATTKLPLALDFLLAELRHSGVLAPAMERLGHYFTPFQSFVIREAEDERGKFDMRIALEILHREALYRADHAPMQGVFLFQFETLCRNRLGYDSGLSAMAADPAYDEAWKSWILKIRRQVGAVDIADLLYVRSGYYVQLQQRQGKEGLPPDEPPLFGEREGRIALANRHKDPLLLFAALHRHLGYPAVPLPSKPDQAQQLLPQILTRLERLEARVKLIEEEQRGGIDLSKYYVKPDDPRDFPGSNRPGPDRSGPNWPAI